MDSDRNFRRFYVLVPAQRSESDTEFFKADPIIRGDAPVCGTCGRFLGMRRWLSPRRAEVVVHGARAGDFAFRSSSEFLVSEAVVKAFEEEGLTGLNDLEEVTVSATLRAAPVQPRRYYYGEITLHGADVDPLHSNIERTENPECDWCIGSGIASIHGFEIADQSWSGADMFVARGLPGVVVVSEAFRRVAEERAFSNLELVPTKDFTWLSSAA
jgi:hypothetical protein